MWRTDRFLTFISGNCDIKLDKMMIGCIYHQGPAVRGVGVSLDNFLKMIVKFIGREIKLVAICETWEYQPPTQQQLVKWFVRCGSEGMHGLSYILPS